MAKPGPVVIHVELDADRLFEEIDNLPDEVLDTLATKLFARIMQAKSDPDDHFGAWLLAEARKAEQRSYTMAERKEREHG
jgi:hypothetical protein